MGIGLRGLFSRHIEAMKPKTIKWNSVKTKSTVHAAPITTTAALKCRKCRKKRYFFCYQINIAIIGRLLPRDISVCHIYKTHKHIYRCNRRHGKNKQRLMVRSVCFSSVSFNRLCFTAEKYLFYWFVSIFGVHVTPNCCSVAMHFLLLLLIIFGLPNPLPKRA